MVHKGTGPSVQSTPFIKIVVQQKNNKFEQCMKITWTAMPQFLSLVSFTLGILCNSTRSEAVSQ